ncbi:hypothetical protein HMPREF9080_02137 [Cardiobacterium valvarum F0432]|uniref:Uncharacterized protein n=1 Tax=Cardiobacterium valvarum F0432 TaxID=797473 RepID=G9ZH80_9GAMM|nr:hypothetical protein HMPREF9080_02137 [Cardiobacterium valvarum F0432]
MRDVASCLSLLFVFHHLLSPFFAILWQIVLRFAPMPSAFVHDKKTSSHILLDRQ